MNVWKKFANEGYEEAARCTSRDVGGHGLNAGAKRIKKLYNRAAMRADAKWHRNNQDA